MEPLTAGDPARVGSFVLRGRLGAGGMGEVFLGRSPGGRAVAVKVVHAHLARQTEFRRRFRREVAAARAVSGAFTAPVVAAGPEDAPPWIATVYVPGPALDEAVAKAGRFPEGSVWPLAAGLVEALQAIHAGGLLHRDLKPSNVLLAADGPRVIDFGIARAMDATVLTGTGTAIGTPGFMSPEQAEGGQVGPAGDVFSLGAVIAFAATGHEPFGQGPPLAVLHRLVTGEPRLDGLTGPLRALVAACLSKDPAHRPTPAQLLGQIAAHWDPPDDFPPTPPWPQAVTGLIQTRDIPATAGYTEHGTTPPSLHSAPTLTAPPRGAPSHQDRLPPDTGHPAGPVGDVVPRPRRPRGLRRRHWHALKLCRSGEFAEAARVLADLIPDRAQAWGPDHRGTLTARLDHAVTVGDAGEHAEAARLLADLIRDFVRLRGPDHLETLLVRHVHALNLGEAGEHAEAARLLADLIPHLARLRGPDHRDTLNARLDHAVTIGDAGGHAEAARLLADLIPHLARLRGPDDKNTLKARHAHASNLGRAGEHAEAARLLADLISDRVRVHGPDHVKTLVARQVHAMTVGEAGEHAEAARLWDDLIPDLARLRGPDDGDTLWARHAHAFTLGHAGEHAEAARLLADLIPDLVRVWGPDHPDTLSARHNHAWQLGEVGDHGEAARLLVGLIPDMARVLGPDHPDTLNARSRADRWTE